jgi:hypothetical protein
MTSMVIVMIPRIRARKITSDADQQLDFDTEADPGNLVAPVIHAVVQTRACERDHNVHE